MFVLGLNIFANSKNMILVEAGLVNLTKYDSNEEKTVTNKIQINDFYINKYEVTQKEFKSIMGFNPSYYKGDNKPVDTVTWYDAILFCNLLSKKEGLTPFYNLSNIVINKSSNPYLHEKSIYTAIVTENKGSKGYRLPSEEEWQFAAMGGKKSKGYIYAGSNALKDVAWYTEPYVGSDGLEEIAWYESIETQVVGGKNPNELGIYDMSGNVQEWINNTKEEEYGLTFLTKGGSISDNQNGFPKIIDKDAATIEGFEFGIEGFRIVRSK